METTSQDRPLILLADDDETTLDLLAMHLADAGYETIRAANGIKALAQMVEYQPRIVISDWLMPKMNGLEICRALREKQGDQLIYFIMLTVQQNKEQLLEAFAAGVDDFLSKPFHQGELLARVRAGERMVRLCDSLATRGAALARANTELFQLNEKLRQLATVDDLTRLPNRRQAMSRLHELWAQALRYGGPLSCAMVDIDKFKTINDTYGHLKGDEILQNLAGVLSQTVRATDAVYRIGGEEFLIVFPQQRAEKAFISAERCRLEVESSIFTGAPGPQKSVTISAGLAQWTPQMQTLDDLLRSADQSLYAAKEQGRNRVILSPETPVPVQDQRASETPVTGGLGALTELICKRR